MVLAANLDLSHMLIYGDEQRRGNGLWGGGAGNRDQEGPIIEPPSLQIKPSVKLTLFTVTQPHPAMSCLGMMNIVNP